MELKDKAILLYSSIISFLNKGDKRSIVAKRNIIASIIIKGLGIGLSFLLVPLLLDYLDPIRYGLWLTITSVVQWFWFFDIGLGNGLRNKFAEAKATKDFELARTYVSTAYYLLGIIVLTVMLIFLPIASFIDWSKVLNAPAELQNELMQIVIVVFIFFMLRLELQLIGTLLLGDQKTAINDSLNPISSFLVILLILMFKNLFPNSFFLASIALSLSPVIVYIFVSTYFFLNEYRVFSPSLNKINWHYGKSLLNLGLFFFIVQIAGVLLYSTTNILITHLLGPAEVTKYNIAYKYFSGIFMIFSIIVAPFWSAFTEANSLKDFNWINRIILKLRKLAFVFSLIILAMIFSAPLFYKLWIGSKMEIDSLVNIFMGCFFAITIFNMPYCYFLNGIGRVKEQAIMAIIAALVHIPLSIFFVHYLKLGLEGIILSLVLVGLPSLILWPYLYKLEMLRNKGLQS